MTLPTGPPIIKGGNGLRKIRFATPGAGKGTRGAYRVFYVYFADFGTVLLMAVLSKADKSDLDKDGLEILSQWIARIETLLHKGDIR